MAKRDFYTSLVLIVFGGGVVLESLRMPRFENLGINPYTVPGIVPGFLGGTLVVFGLVMLVRSRLRGGLGGGGSSEAPRESVTRESVQRLGLTLLLTLGYAAGLVGRLPFWLATLLFVFLFVALFEWQKDAAVPKKMRMLGAALLQAVLVAATVTYVFERIFLVRLP